MLDGVRGELRGLAAAAALIGAAVVGALLFASGGAAQPADPVARLDCQGERYVSEHITARPGAVVTDTPIEQAASWARDAGLSPAKQDFRVDFRSADHLELSYIGAAGRTEAVLLFERRDAGGPALAASVRCG